MKIFDGMKFVLCVAISAAFAGNSMALQGEAKAGEHAQGISRDQAEEALKEIWQAKKESVAVALTEELENKKIVVGDKELKILEKSFGDEPEGGHSLWISMHGGGGAPARVNDQQWNNQIRLYQPEEGIYVAPRAPTNTWNLWHEGHIDPLFERLIAAYVIARGVNPDRVYLMGYSAGGDGVYQLGPRMADTFAAVSMMAGHPNESRPDGLRNLPFALYVGGKDAAYDRNKKAPEWGKLLDDLQEQDPEGYVHRLTVYPDKGHWMDGEDRDCLPWMAGFVRNAWPKKIVWRQDDVTHQRFYWLGVDKDAAHAGQKIVAEVSGQKISVECEDLSDFIFYLRDELIDLNQPITVVANGKQVFSGKVERSREAIERSLDERLDERMAATAILQIGKPVSGDGG